MRTPSGLFFSQNKYVTNPLRKYHLHAVKPITTHVVFRVTLSLLDGELLADPTDYRSMVRIVVWLAHCIT